MYPAHHVLGSRRNGVNHVGMAMGDFNRASGPVRGTNYPVYPDALLDWYRTKGIKSARVMFAWEAVQSALGGPVPPAAGAGTGYASYWADLTSVVTRLLARDIYVILAPWQYNTASGDTDIVYDDASFTPAQFADFWGKLAAAVNGVTGSDRRVAFDLINEPHTHAQSGNRPGDIGITLPDWFACAQAAITAIRGTGGANTVFVPGMQYTAASGFVTNGSAAAYLGLNDPLRNIAVTVHCYSGLNQTSRAVLRNACSGLVAWARANGVKVNIGEIAMDAGPNGRARYCSTFATATAQWADWTAFCAANADVIVGWNWWANSAGGAWWNQADSCDATSASHWGLTLDNGASQTLYMDLIQASLPVPALHLRDNAADTGAEPNATTTIGWESLDVWPRQTADGGTVGETLTGGQPAVVYVRVTNRGLAPSGGNDVVRLYWAKAEAGLSWPAPWNGANPVQGGPVAPPQPAGVIQPGAARTIAFNWANPPDPANYRGDGHFCLLAFVTPQAAPEFAEFQGPDLNQNVLALNHVAWRNIHITFGFRALGRLVVANHSSRDELTVVAFEALDDAGRPADTTGARLTITPEGTALERLREAQGDRPFLEDLGGGTFQVTDLAAGIPRLHLRPGEVLSFDLEYVPAREGSGHAVRATQFVLDGGSRHAIGGQTFVVGEVDGFSAPPARRRGGSCLLWLAASLGLLLLSALFGGGRKRT